MGKTNKEAIVQLRSIEPIHFHLNEADLLTDKKKNHQFKIAMESTANETNQTITVLMEVLIESYDKFDLGGIKIGYQYLIRDFEKKIKPNAAGQLQIPKSILEYLQNISYSTTRGILFTKLQTGKHHSFILPVIEYQNSLKIK